MSLEAPLNPEERERRFPSHRVKVPEGFRYAPGQIRVNSINVLLSEPNFMVVEIDTRSKYPDVNAWGSGEEPDEVLLFADERTLRADTSTSKPSLLTLPQHTAGWRIAVQAGRYTVEIVAWKDPRS